MASKRDGKTATKPGSTAATPPAPLANFNENTERDDGPRGLRRLAGAEYKALNNTLANQALAALWLPPGQPEEHERRYTAALGAMMEFKPKDAIEGMMAAQAIGLHSAAMECMRRAMIPDQYGEAADRFRKQSANLSRAFLDVIAALDRKRGKGTQVVRVERVMVAPGGQAIVGNVQGGGSSRDGQQGGGVGHGTETGGEPHATAASRTTEGGTPARLAHDAAPGAVLPPVWGADPDRDAVPVPRDGQRAVPDARRRQHGA